jgi:phenylacetyl-CoA:acceptor oxidoreductase subunit 1
MCGHFGGVPRRPLKVIRNRNNDIVTISKAHTIGAGYCAVAGPYRARYKSNRPRFAFGDCPTEAEAARFTACRLGVATKCTFRAGGCEAGLVQGLRPGVDAEAIAACALGASPWRFSAT